MFLHYSLISKLLNIGVQNLNRFKFLTVSIIVTFPDFTRHFFPSLAESVDTFVEVVLNQWTPMKKLCCFY